MYKIYTLSLVSDSEVIRYVGQTKQSLHRRLQGHKRDTIRGKHHVNNWFRKNLGNILITEIDSCETVEESNKLEINYIKLFKACGAKLTNIHEGGNNHKRMKPLSQESIERMRRASKGRTWTEEHRQKYIKARKGVKATPEAIENNRLSHLGKGTKSISVCNLQTKEIKIFKSMNDGAKFFNLKDSTSITKVIKNNKIFRKTFVIKFLN